MTKFNVGDVITPSPTQGIGWTLYRKDECLTAQITRVDTMADYYHVKIIAHVDDVNVNHEQRLGITSVNHSFVLVKDLLDLFIAGVITQKQYEKASEGQGNG